MEAKKSDQSDSVGKKIKKTRLSKHIPLESIANETGFSIDYLKKIESGKKIPSVSSLLQIARVLNIDSGFLLEDEKTNLKTRIRDHATRTDNYAYKTLTPGAENKHMKAFRVSIDPMQEHQGIGYCHEGEEFVYVISGEIELMVGKHKNTLKADESLHFNSGIKHQLKNIGGNPANLLVVIYGP
ncbi:MAG: helix-turn-helix transcriptional regulator [SAR324 cluster bacterium]|nr:helix-turn-helix transcriptional regulator [SAR324 cluster bacterium]